MQIQHLLFTFGLIFGSLVLINREDSFKNYLKLLIFVSIFSLVGFVYVSLETEHYSFENFFTIFFVLFPVSFFVVFAKDFLIKINELVLLSFTLIFWYVFLINFNPNLFLILLFLLPTIGVLFLVFSKFELSNYWKLIFYLWFLTIDIFLILSYSIHGNLLSFIFMEGVSGISLIESFLTGMIFLHLFCNLLCFFFLFNVGGKDFKLQSFSKTIKEVTQNAQFIFNKYSLKQSKLLHSLIIIILQGGFLVFNYFYSFVPDFLLISIFIFISPQLLTARRNPKSLRI